MTAPAQYSRGEFQLPNVKAPLPQVGARVRVRWLGNHYDGTVLRSGWASNILVEFTQKNGTTIRKLLYWMDPPADSPTGRSYGSGAFPLPVVKCSTCHDVGEILVDGKPVACEECSPDCLHEDVTLECEFCGRAIDSDAMVCLTCKEGVAGVKRCVHCEEVLA